MRLAVEGVSNDARVSGFSYWKDDGHSMSGKKRVFGEELVE